MALNRNRKTLFFLLVYGLAMLGVAYAFVPLYRIMCQQFGIPVPSVLVGRAAEPKPINAVSDRTVTVRFVANQADRFPVMLEPVTFSMKVKLGQRVLTAYRARNTSPEAKDGVAVHMLYAMGGKDSIDVPKYVDLQQCFCFELQHYPANAEVTLPLSFAITPDLPEGIHTISFAYTLFEALPNDPRIKKHADR